MIAAESVHDIGHVVFALSRRAVCLLFDSDSNCPMKSLDLLLIDTARICRLGQCNSTVSVRPSVCSIYRPLQ